MSLALVEVTRENVETVCRLRVAEHQERLVAPAAVTVAEAKCYGPAAYLRAITFEHQPVGVRFPGDRADARRRGARAVGPALSVTSRFEA